MDLLDLDFDQSVVKPSPHSGTTSPVNNIMDLLGDVHSSAIPSNQSPSSPGLRYGFSYPKSVFLSAQEGKGLEIAGTFSRRSATLLMTLFLNNKALAPMSDFAIQLNKNKFVDFCYFSIFVVLGFLLILMCICCCLTVVLFYLQIQVPGPLLIPLALVW